MIRFTEDWSGVRHLDPDADIAMLRSLGAEWQNELKVTADIVNDVMQDASCCVQATPPKPSLVNDPRIYVEQMMKIYVDRPEHESSTFKGRSDIYNEMRSMFERRGLWRTTTNDIPASRYTHPGNPLSIDCTYKTADRFHVIQAVSLSGLSDDASRLVSSLASLRAGILRVEEVELDLLTVVESRNARWSTGALQQYRYNLEIMEEVGIRSIPLNDIGQAEFQALSAAA
jgi:hypothetical protein